MRNWRTSWLATILMAACATAAMLAAGSMDALAADEHPAHLGKPIAGPLPDVSELVDEMTGTVPENQQTEAINYQNPPLKPELPLFLFTLILFTVFVLVMKSMVWQPLMSGLNARESRIVRAEADARAARVEVEKLTAQAEQRMAEVYAEVKTIVAQARSAAEARKLEIISQAEAEAQRIKQDALAAIANARAGALAELEQTVDEQVGLATHQIAGRRL